MTKNLKKLTALVAAAAVAYSMIVPSVAFAVDTTSYNGTYADTDSEQSGIAAVNGDMIITKSLAIEKNANIPASSFNYKITPATESPTDSKYVVKSTNANTLSVLVGLNPEKISVTSWNAGDRESGDTALAVDGDTVGELTFKIPYAVQEVVRSGDTIQENATDDDDVTIAAPTEPVAAASYYFANKSVLLDFTNCGFTEPGIYRYFIQESETNQGITNDVKWDDTNKKYVTKDVDNYRTIDVYVVNSSDADASPYGLKVQGYVLYEDDITTAPDKDNDAGAGTKSTGYINSYDTSDISFGKRVEGNQGSKDKFFKFTVEISEAVPGTVYNVDISNAVQTVPSTGLNAATDSSYAGQSNQTSITIGEDGTKTTDFYLQHGQSITIKGLSKDTKYTITETKEDYNTKYSDDFDDVDTTGLEKLTNYLTNGSPVPTLNDGYELTDKIVVSEDIETAFVNTRDGILPTGIIMSVAPTAAAGIIVIAIIAALLFSARRRRLEEE